MARNQPSRKKRVKRTVFQDARPLQRPVHDASSRSEQDALTSGGRARTYTVDDLRRDLKHNLVLFRLVLRWISYGTIRLLPVAVFLAVARKVLTAAPSLVEWGTLTAMLAGWLTVVLTMFKVAASHVTVGGSFEWRTARPAMNRGMLREFEVAGVIVGTVSVIALLMSISLATVSAIRRKDLSSLDAQFIATDYVNTSLVVGPLFGLVLWAGYIARTEASHYLLSKDPASRMASSTWLRRFTEAFMPVAMIAIAGALSAFIISVMK